MNHRDDPFDIGRFDVDPRNAWTLPASYFRAPEVFEAETSRIFLKSWRLVGHLSQLPNPGDYLTADICGNGVFVVRGRDGEPRGFHNVCQHRAHRLLKDRSGSIKAVITCPYHAWAYGTDGGLRAAKNSENIAGFDKREFGLKPVAVEVFCGFVFVNLDTGAMPLRDSVPDFEPMLRRYVPDLDRMAWTGQQDFAIAANWKVVVENSLDGYHVNLSGPAHRAFGRLIDDHLEMIPRHGWLLLRSGVGAPDNGAYDFRPNIGKGQTADYVTFFLWPDLLLFTYPHVNGMWSFLMAPEGPERTREEIAAYTPNGVAIDPATQGAIDWMNNALGPEDVELNVGVQTGLRSMGYHQSRLLIDEARSDMSEHSIHYFQTKVLEALGRLPPGSSDTLLADDSVLARALERGSRADG